MHCKMSLVCSHLVAHLPSLHLSPFPSLLPPPSTHTPAHSHGVRAPIPQTRGVLIEEELPPPSERLLTAQLRLPCG